MANVHQLARDYRNWRRYQTVKEELIAMTNAGGMFGVPKEMIPNDLYTMLVRAKTRDWQGNDVGPPPMCRREWVVARLIEIRQYSREIAENYYDRYVCDWLEA